MRHRVAAKRLKRASGEFKALLKNQAKQLFDRGSVTTTLQKAKLVRPFAEKLITTAKEPSFNAVKRVKQVLADDQAVKRLVSDVAPMFKTRPGGYTRILKLGNRGGDNAQMARIELVEKSGDSKKVVKTKKEAKKEVKQNAKNKKEQKTGKKIIKKEKTNAKD